MPKQTKADFCVSHHSRTTTPGAAIHGENEGCIDLGWNESTMEATPDELDVAGSAAREAEGTMQVVSRAIADATPIPSVARSSQLPHQLRSGGLGFSIWPLPWKGFLSFTKEDVAAWSGSSF
jgi:hypothetical protein